MQEQPRPLEIALMSYTVEPSKAFAEAGISADDAAEAFRRAAEIAHNILTPETEIALIKQNPSLSRFQKWRLIRRTKRRTHHEKNIV